MNLQYLSFLGSKEGLHLETLSVLTSIKSFRLLRFSIVECMFFWPMVEILDFMMINEVSLC